MCSSDLQTARKQSGSPALEKAWVVSIRDQCQQARVPFFFKQWGGVRKSKAGRELDGRTYDELPPRADRPVPEARRRLAAVPAIADLYPAQRQPPSLPRHLTCSRCQRNPSSNRTRPARPPFPDRLVQHEVNPRTSNLASL